MHRFSHRTPSLPPTAAAAAAADAAVQAAPISHHRELKKTAGLAAPACGRRITEPRKFKVSSESEANNSKRTESGKK